MSGVCAMETLREDVAVTEMNFVIRPAIIEDCDQIYELVQVRCFPNVRDVLYSWTLIDQN